MSKDRQLWLETYLNKVIELVGDGEPTQEQADAARKHADKVYESAFGGDEIDDETYNE